MPDPTPDLSHPTGLEAFLQRHRAVVARAILSLVIIIAFLGLAACIILYVMWKIVPSYTGVTATLGMPRPLLLEILIGSSHFLLDYTLFVVLGIHLIAAVMLMVYANPASRHAVRSFLMGSPLIGHIQRRLAHAHFAGSLSSHLDADIPLPRALETVREATHNTVASEAIAAIQRDVERGRTLHQAASASVLFGPIAAGIPDRTNASPDLATALEQCADNAHLEVRRTVRTIHIITFILGSLAILLLLAGVVALHSHLRHLWIELQKTL